MPNGSTQCPCGALVPVTAELVGLTTQCPKCRRLLPVRAGDLKPAASRGEPQRAVPAPQPAAKPAITRASQPPASTPQPSPRPATKTQTANSSPRPVRQDRFDRSPPTHEPKVRGPRAYLFVGAITLAVVTTAALGIWLGSGPREQAGEPAVARATEPAVTKSGGERPAPQPVPAAPANPTVPAVPPAPGGAPPAVPPGVPPVAAPELPASLNEVAATYKREVVRVNHPRNCVLCHPPSFQTTDLVRGAVPDQSQPLPPPTTPEYYSRGGQFVSADVTYLRQDFSVVQPVLDSGNWSSHQRYDYFVQVRKVDAPEAGLPSEDSPYRKALTHALRELAGRDPQADRAWVSEQAALAPAERRLAEVAQLVSLQTDPKALIALKAADFATPLLTRGREALERHVTEMQETYGPVATRSALIAYLDPLARTGGAESRERATRLLSVLAGATPDRDLPRALAAAMDAATAPGAPPAARPERPAPKRASHAIRRLDSRTTEEIEKELLGVREVKLDGDSTKTADLIELAKRRKANGQPYPGPAFACDGRADLAGLPLRMGLDASLSRERAEALHALSLQLRESVQACIPPRDVRPNPDRLRDLLLARAGGPGRGFVPPAAANWEKPEAVPCVQQILAAENRDVRKVASDLLAKITGQEATEALVQRAVFETDPTLRALAVDALRTRSDHNVGELLVRYVRYPWPRAVEHAVEALVALGCTEVVPQLAAAYLQADPDAPFRVLSGRATARKDAPSTGVAVAPRPPSPSPVPAPVPAPAGTPATPPPTGSPPVVVPAAPSVAVAPLPRTSELARLNRLVEVAQRTDPEDRKRAAFGLAEYLSSPDRDQRATAAETLAALRKAAAPAVPALERALSETDDGVLSDIKTALAFGLAAELDSKDSAVRVRALEQLALLGRSAKVVGADVIRVMGRDKVKKVQTAATDALEKIAPKVHEHVTTLLYGTDKRGAVDRLGGLGREGEMAADLLFELVEAIKNPAALADDRVRLLEALAKLAPTDQRFEKHVLESVRIPIVKKAPAGLNVNDLNRRFGLRHIQMISATNVEKAKALTAALEDGHLRDDIIGELVKLGADAAPALPQLKKLKMSTDDHVRKVATDAVNQIESAKKP